MPAASSTPRAPATSSRLDLRALLAARPAVLAPMSGVTDLAFRVLAHRLGAGLVVSEMVASEALALGRADMARRAQGAGAISPLAVQLAGREARWMALGAKIARDAGADVIDINMGCPAKQVTRGASGSALMRDLDHAMTLIEAVLGAVDVPVTLKMRLGWDERSQNAPELARRAEAAGVEAVTVHGRTRCQFFDGSANWDAVRAVTAAVAIPVVVNGDIAAPPDARAALERSGAAGGKLGRAALGAPWLPGLIAAGLVGRPAAPPAPPARSEIVLEHLDRTLSLYGANRGVRIFRKHLNAYLAPPGVRGEGSAAELGAEPGAEPGADAARARVRRLCQLSHPNDLRAALRDHFAAERAPSARPG